MAEFRSITPRNLFRDQYIPENDPAWREGQDRFSTNPILNAGERALDAQRQFRLENWLNQYNYAITKLGKTEQEARAIADQGARDFERGEAILSALGPEALGAGVGKVTSGVSKAVDLARSLLGGRRAAEPQALLAAPRRNAMFADEMLDIEPPAPTYSGPRRLESGEFLPRIDIPRVQSSGITARDVVSSPFDDIGRMAGEGGLTDDAIAAARRMARERVAAEESFRTRQLAEMEGEGGTAVNEALRQRALKAAEDAGLTARQMSAGEGEGMLTADAVEAAKAMARRRLEAQEAAHQARLDRMTDEGGGMAMTRPMEKGVPPPGTGFTLGESSGSYSPNFIMPGAGRTQAGSFGLPTTRGSSEILDLRPVGVAGSNMPAFLGALGGGGGTAAALYAARQLAGDKGTQASPVNVRQMDSTLFGEDTGQRPANVTPMDSTLFGEDTGRRPANVRLMDSTLFGENMPNRGGGTASRRDSAAAAPAQAVEPAAKTLWDAYNRSMMDEGGGRADLFEMARKAEMGRARGGTANGGGKDAAIHKALEIIHHMLVNK